MANKTVFSHDDTTAIMVSQDNDTAAVLVSQTNPVGVELLFYVTLSFVAIICMASGHVSENTLFNAMTEDGGLMVGTLQYRYWPGSLSSYSLTRRSTLTVLLFTQNL